MRGIFEVKSASSYAAYPWVMGKRDAGSDAPARDSLNIEIV